jgi:hypothetical protein
MDQPGRTMRRRERGGKVAPPHRGHELRACGAARIIILLPDFQTAQPHFRLFACPARCDARSAARRRTGFYFAWACSPGLASGFSAGVFRRLFSLRSQSAGAGLLLPTKRARIHSHKRERSAVKGATVVSVLPRGSTCRPCGTSSPYGAPLRRFRRWDPSASPGRHGYCPMALFRRRDGRFHPMLLSEQGGLLHSSPGTWLARPCARAPHPIHAQIALQSAPQRMGMLSKIYQ